MNMSWQRHVFSALLLVAAGLIFTFAVAFSRGADPDELFREALEWELGTEEFVPEDPAFTKDRAIWQNYREAAGKGHVEAFYRLGLFSQDGDDYLEAAAMLGHQKAAVKLAASGRKLTLDPGMQAIAEQELEAALKKYAAAGHQTGGCILVAESKTGRMLAMAYCLAAAPCAFRYEPGGSFFPIAVAAALDSGKLSLGEKMDCSPIFVSAGAGGLGVGSGEPLVIADILRKTCNPGMVRLSWKLGIPTYRKYMAAFGFASPSGGVLADSNESNLAFVLPDEPDKQKQGNLSLARICCGREWLVTPLQMIKAYVAISNGGVMMPLSLVDKKVYGTRIMRAETAGKVKQALAEASGDAGGEGAAGLRLMGKSGTAHRMKPDGRYDEGRYTLSFAGIMSAGEKELVCLVVLDDPNPRDCWKGGGLKVCAPLFRNVARRLVPLVRGAGDIEKSGNLNVEFK